MADDDLTLTARLKVVLDEQSTRQEATKAAGVFGQAFQNFGKGFIGGVTGQRPETRTAEGGVGAAVGQLTLLGGSLYTLKRILGVLEESSGYLQASAGILSTAIKLALKPFGDAIAKLTMPIVINILGSAVAFNKDTTELGFWEGLGKTVTDAAGRLINVLPTLTGLGKYIANLGPSAVYGAENPLGIGGLLPSPRFTSSGGANLSSFMAQWGAENPGGWNNQWMGGPEVSSLTGRRSLGTAATLESQERAGMRLVPTSQWGSTNIGAQGKWWGPSATSGDILSRLQQYYQIANYGGAVNGWNWGDVSKQAEKMLSDPSSPKSASYLMNQIGSYIEPIGTTWSRTSEYGNSMADVMTRGSSGRAVPDAATLFAGLNFGGTQAAKAPIVNVYIGNEILQDYVLEIIDGSAYLMRTATP